MKNHQFIWLLVGTWVTRSQMSPMLHQTVKTNVTSGQAEFGHFRERHLVCFQNGLKTAIPVGLCYSSLGHSLHNKVENDNIYEQENMFKFAV